MLKSGRVAVRALGPLAVESDGVPVKIGATQLRLLAVLVVHRDRGLSHDELIEYVWGPVASASGEKRLQMAISRLRQALAAMSAAPELEVMTVTGGYRLAIGPGVLDADRFDELVRQGRRELESDSPQQARALLDEALELWRGPPLADVTFADFAQPEMRRLEEMRLLALETQIEAQLALGEHRELIGRLQALLAEHPTREQFAAQLMRALYHAGRQAEALQAYQRIRSHLASELGLEPGPALMALQARILTQDPDLGNRGASGSPELGVWRASSVGGQRRPPSPATPTVGRRREVEEIGALLDDPSSRLVTLLGPGGVGKTRVAVAVAHERSPGITRDSVWVDLVGVARPDEVDSAIVRAFALTPLAGESNLDALRRHLSHEQGLVIVDNFEHVLPARNLIGELLVSCPNLQILVTSREPLDLAGEHRVEIRPLPVPSDTSRLTVAEVETIDATALFLAAARRHARAFEVTPKSASAIATVCAELDGLPLALELAAARVGALGLDGLSLWIRESKIELGHGPRDGPARQQTLWATIDWSHQLLTEGEQAAFARFAVFAGGAAVDAAHAILGASLRTLEALIAKSLISRWHRDDGSVRLMMLETIREYALTRLNADVERDSIRRAHLEHYLQVFQRHVPLLLTHDLVPARRILDAEIDNARGALEWSRKANPALSLRLAGVVGEYWVITHDPGGLRWLDAAIDAAGDCAPVSDRARAHLRRAVLISFIHDSREVVDDLKLALSLYRKCGDHAGMSETLSALAVTIGVMNDDLARERRYAAQACHHARLAGDDGLLGRALGRLAAATIGSRGPILREAADILERVGDYAQLASAYSDSGYVAIVQGEIAEATELLTRAVRAISHTEDRWMAGIIAGNLGLAHLFAGSHEEARHALEQKLRLCQPAQSPAYDIGEPLAGLAALAATDGHFETAARLRGGARAAGYPPAAFDRHIDDRLERDYFAPARAAYGQSRWDQAERVGAASSREVILDHAFDRQHNTRMEPQAVRNSY